MSHLHPAVSTPPGQVLARELAARDWSITHLATLTGYSPDTLRPVCHGLAPIDERLAIALSDAFGTSIEFWLNLQAEYDQVERL